MKYCLPVFLLMAGAATAGPIAPARYVDAQGVEIIHNRSGAPVAGEGGGVVTVAGAAAPAVRPPSQPPLPKMQVSASEQQSRDRDRVAILQQELATEVRALEGAFQRAKQAVPDKLNAADSRRVTEEMYAHQQNILSLHNELRRAGQPR